MGTIRYTAGNLLESKQEALVNTVNLEGYMGKGIAYQFKKRFPENNKAYIEACKNNNIGIGKVFSFKEDGKIIINFPTKDRWREKTKISYIEKGLESLKRLITDSGISSVAIPPLGCGNGGLEWSEVKPLIEERLKELKNVADILIYEPTLNNPSVKSKKQPVITLSSFLILACMKNLRFADKVSMQKAVFILNLMAKNNFFEFSEYKHGPYSYGVEKAHQVADAFLEYHDLNRYDITDLNTAVKAAYKTVAGKKAEYYAPIMKKAKRIWNSFKSAKELEIAATVLHIIQNHGDVDKYDVVEYFLNRYPKEDASIFGRDEILKNIDSLLEDGILQADIFGNLKITI
jgi:appr-1-p processing enzyme family protein